MPNVKANKRIGTGKKFTTIDDQKRDGLQLVSVTHVGMYFKKMIDSQNISDKIPFHLWH